MCACDGAKSAEALARSQGGYCHLANTLLKNRQEATKLVIEKASTTKPSKISTRSKRCRTAKAHFRKVP